MKKSRKWYNWGMKKKMPEKGKSNSAEHKSSKEELLMSFLKKKKTQPQNQSLRPNVLTMLIFKQEHTSDICKISSVYRRPAHHIELSK